MGGESVGAANTFRDERERLDRIGVMPEEIRPFAQAGIGDGKLAAHAGTARFPSIESWVRTDVKGWTLADLIDAGQACEAITAREARDLGTVDGADRRRMGNGVSGHG